MALPDGVGIPRPFPSLRAFGPRPWLYSSRLLRYCLVILSQVENKNHSACSKVDRRNWPSVTLYTSSCWSSLRPSPCGSHIFLNRHGSVWLIAHFFRRLNYVFHLEFQIGMLWSRVASPCTSNEFPKQVSVVSTSNTRSNFSYFPFD